MNFAKSFDEVRKYAIEMKLNDERHEYLSL